MHISRQPTRTHTVIPISRMQWLVIVLLSFASANLSAQVRAAEDDVKAAYLFNFGKFVRYPADQLPSSFDICVLGRDPIQHSLEAIALNERVDDRPVRVRQLDNPADARACAIVYIGASEAARVDKDIAALQGSTALTVSDLPKFIEHGGMIQFLLQSNKLRFGVDLGPTMHARLSLSSELLKVAVFVHTPPPQETP